MNDFEYDTPPKPPNQLSTSSSASHASEAADLIRQKIASLYAEEPSAKKEIQSISHQQKLSEHQRHMDKLTKSGMSLAEIQTAWHKYYAGLPDTKKHEVWQEFYQSHQEHPKQQHPSPIIEDKPTTKSTKKHTKHNYHRYRQAIKHKKQTVANVKKQILNRPPNRRAITKKQHAKSMLFGISLGSIVMLLFLFGFFNERFIAPFVTPSRQVSSTPIINDPNNTTVGSEPKIIIPKINVEIPVVYDEKSVEEKSVQNALERGVLHYATTSAPGEKGNSVIFGHSSNNILNRGQYKFAFVLLSKLDTGDVFYLNYNGTRYTYKVFDKKVVKPTDLGVLGNAGRPATATLITCDPPGTSINRLVVVGEQISPSPDANKQSTAIAAEQQPNIIPSNAPSLWQRIVNWF